jgi:hypothetical protein
MTRPMEHDWPPTMRPRRRPRIETVEILPPRQAEHYVRVTVRHQATPPAWIIPLAIIAALSMITPYGLIVTIVVAAVFVTAHPAVAIAFAASLVLVIAIGVVQRWRGHPF